MDNTLIFIQVSKTFLLENLIENKMLCFNSKRDYLIFINRINKKNPHAWLVKAQPNRSFRFSNEICS